jgi:catechol 2,3-dioxygenase-like lactoylglutathione lyase family enzyme
MITHISTGVRDIERSKRFYDAVLEPLGYKCLRGARSLVGYGCGQHRVLGCPGRAPGFSRRKVRSPLLLCGTGCRCRRCISCGGTARNGPPGLRPIYTPDYYAAFIIDPDGYRIEAYYGPGET